MASSSKSLQASENQWHTPLWAVWRDVSLNCMVCFCPSCAFADTVTRLDGRYAAWCPPCFAHTCASLILSCALVGADTRRQIRETFRLPQEPWNDYVVHCLCCWCALCQEAREIKHRSQLLAPPSLASQLVPAGNAPEVQLMARSKSKAASLKEWEWRPAGTTASSLAGGAHSASGGVQPFLPSDAVAQSAAAVPPSFGPDDMARPSASGGGDVAAGQQHVGGSGAASANAPQAPDAAAAAATGYSRQTWAGEAGDGLLSGQAMLEGEIEILPGQPAMSGGAATGGGSLQLLDSLAAASVGPPG